MPEVFKVPGFAKAPPVPDARLQKLLRIETRQFVEVRPDVRGAADFATLDNVAADDVIEMEFEDGIRQWIRADQLREDLQRSGVSRGTADGYIQIPASFPAPGSLRGEKGGSLQLRFFKVHTIDLGSLVRDIANDLVEHGKEALAKKLLETFAEPTATMATRYILNWL